MGRDGCSRGRASVATGRRVSDRWRAAGLFGLWVAAGMLAGAELGRAEEPGARAIEAAPGATAPSAPPAIGTTRFKLTPEQQETLRLAREAEARTLLGLAPDVPLPAAGALSEEQTATIRAAREAEMRRVLGLAPGEPIPDRSRVTADQRQKIEAAHEARIRAALGLAADVPLEREPIPSASPASPAAPASAAPAPAADVAPESPAAQGAPQ